MAGRVNRFPYCFSRAESGLLLPGGETPFGFPGGGGREAALLEVLLMRYLDSVSISVLFEDRLGKIAQFITSLKGNYFTSVFLK